MDNNELLEFFKSHIETSTFLPVKGLVRLGYSNFPRGYHSSRETIVVPVSLEIREFILGK